jgi:Asp-tRNA(Asn)/Glu-tRNA(Gln) amidotransferase C subunit
LTGSKNNPGSQYNAPKRASSHQDHVPREKPKFEHDNKLPSSAQVNRIQTNKILELQLAAIEKKLGEKTGHAESGDVERLRSQLREKDAELQRALQKISELKRQLQSLESRGRQPQKKPVPQQVVRKEAAHEETKPWKPAPKAAIAQKDAAAPQQQMQRPRRRHH